MRWDLDMTKYYLNKKPLKELWVPQYDDETQQTSYFNTDSGEKQDEHPHMKLVRAKRKQERRKGLKMLRERVSTLESYKERLRGGEARGRKALCDLLENTYQKAITE